MSILRMVTLTSCARAEGDERINEANVAILCRYEQLDIISSIRNAICVEKIAIWSVSVLELVSKLMFSSIYITAYFLLYEQCILVH